jgi:NAD(P)-dependent dehydrogenase (short-subunit alcohol dehydrogenase family)
MSISLAGKVALVTGGSAGLGAVIVNKLAREGCHVAINYSSSKQRAEDLAQSITRAHNVKAITIQGDVSKQNSCESLVKQVVEQLGRIDVLVSNAGWTRMIDFSNLDALTDEDWDGTYAMNVKAHFFLFRAVKPHFEQNEDGGSFIVTGSVAGLKAAGSSIPYAVSKAGAAHLVKCLAKAHGPKSRVNLVAPGLLLTEWGLKFGQEKIKKIEAAMPLKQAPPLDDVAELFISIAKNRAMTGSIVAADSGVLTI